MEPCVLAKKDLEAALAVGDNEAVINAIERLAEVPMTLEILRETKVGVMVGKLRKTGSSADISSRASLLVDAWRPLTSSNSPSLTSSQQASQSPPLSQKQPRGLKRSTPDILSQSGGEEKRKKSGALDAREAAVALVKNALGARDEEKGEQDPDQIAKELEATVFTKHGEDACNSEYRQRVRSIALNLGEPSHELRDSVMRGDVTPQRLAEMTAAEMAPSSVKEWRKKVEAEFLKDAIGMTINDLASTDQFECPRCHKKKSSFSQMQTRSADEPMTTFVFCHVCRHRWVRQKSPHKTNGPFVAATLTNIRCTPEMLRRASRQAAG